MNRPMLPDFSAVRGRHLLIALSGGADSVALAHLLASRRSALGLTLSAAHIEHGIRGKESLADADFCQSLCSALSIPLTTVHANIPEIARTSGEGLETAARRIRYDALRRIKAETGADWIVLAHHLDDQAETVLMHLLRGSGPNGLSGMAEFSGDLYRPLLSIPKSALVNYLAENGISWRTDSTNLIADTPRNSLRLHGLPALEESYPSAKQAIARYAESAACENRLLDRLANDFLRDHLRSGAYGTCILHPENADEAILRRALRKICELSLSHDKLLELVALCRLDRGKTEIDGRLFAEKTPNALYLLPKKLQLPKAMSLPESGEITFGTIGRLTIAPCRAIPVRDDPFAQVLRRDALCGAVLRTRMDGDRIRPLGCGDKLLSDLFTDRKIDRPLRATIPLVAIGSRILWAVGAAVSEDAKLHTEQDDAVLLRWEYFS